MSLKFKTTNTIDDKLASVNISSEKIENKEIQTYKAKKKEIGILTNSPSILERLNIVTKPYKRVGVDILEDIDNEIEEIAYNILKDKASKKDIYNEALAIGLPLWKEKLKSSKNNY